MLLCLVVCLTLLASSFIPSPSLCYTCLHIVWCLCAAPSQFHANLYGLHSKQTEVAQEQASSLNPLPRPGEAEVAMQGEGERGGGRGKGGEGDEGEREGREMRGKGRGGR